MSACLTQPEHHDRAGLLTGWAAAAASPFGDIPAVFGSLPLPFLSNLSVISLIFSPPFSTPPLILAASSCLLVWPLPCPGPLPCPVRARGGVTALPSAPGQSWPHFHPHSVSPDVASPPIPGNRTSCPLFLAHCWAQESLQAFLWHGLWLSLTIFPKNPFLHPRYLFLLVLATLMLSLGCSFQV